MFTAHVLDAWLPFPGKHSASFESDPPLSGKAPCPDQSSEYCQLSNHLVLGQSVALSVNYIFKVSPKKKV